jgi:molybdopterin/thiamine biosynthesis adenylyltransferase
MTRRYIKTPSGGYIPHIPSKLRLFIQVRAKAILTLPAQNPPKPEPAAGPQAQPTYATDFFDGRLLAGQQVLVFGAGSVGGHVLMSIGYTNLTIYLIDSKKVEAKHTQAGRTIYDSTQIGQFKVNAAKEKLERNFIGTQIIPMPYDVAELPDPELLRLFALAAIVILVIDDPVQILRINQLAYSQVEIIQVGIHRQGHSGHIAVSVPGQTPCLACTLNITSHRDIRRLDSEPAAGIDIAVVSQLAARLALDILHSKVTGKPIIRWDILSKNLIYIANTQQSNSPEGPGFQYQSGRKRHGCPICNNPSRQ